MCFAMIILHRHPEIPSRQDFCEPGGDIKTLREFRRSESRQDFFVNPEASQNSARVSLRAMQKRAMQKRAMQKRVTWKRSFTEYWLCTEAYVGNRPPDNRSKNKWYKDAPNCVPSDLAAEPRSRLHDRR